MQDGVCMTTTQYGVLTGVGFAFTFSLFGLVAGFIVDLYANRDSTILGISALLCAVTTFFASYCTDFEQVLVLRALLGCFQAFGAPASVHLIMSHFERPSDKPVANASYTVGVYLGAGLSSLSSLISEAVGWKVTFRLAGGLGIATVIFYELMFDSSIAQQLWSQCLKAEQVGEQSPLLFRKGGNDNNKVTGVSVASASTSAESVEKATKREEGGPGQQHLAMREDWNHEFSDAETERADLGLFGPTSSSQALESFVSDSFASRGKKAASMYEDEDEDEESGAGAEGGFRRRVMSICVKATDSLQWVLAPKGLVPWSMPLLLLGSSLRFSASIAVFVYTPVIVSRRFPAHTDTFSVFNAVVVLSCGSASAYLGGKLGRLAVLRIGLAGLPRLVAASSLLCLGPLLFAIVSDSFWPCMSLLALGYLLGEAWMGASMALLQGLAPARAQGLTMSLYLFLNWNLSAASTDALGALDPGTDELAAYMVYFVGVPILLSSACFLLLDYVISRNDRVKTAEEQSAGPQSSMRIMAT